MTLILNGKGLLLEGSTPKIEDKQVPGIYIIYLPYTWILQRTNVILSTLCTLKRL